MSKKPQNKFNGFEQSNTTPVPDILFDEIMSELSGSELKVLLYIIRRTKGFKKDTDAISLTQFEKGIIKGDGTVLDKGCGLNRETICKALKSLEEKGYIKSEKRTTGKGDNDVTLYSIRFKGEVVGKTNQGGRKNGPPNVVGKSAYGSRKNSTGVVGKSDPQETVLQQTVKQQTEGKNDTCQPNNSTSENSFSHSSSQVEEVEFDAGEERIRGYANETICKANHLKKSILNKGHCSKLAGHIKTIEQFRDLIAYSRKEQNLEKKKLHIGNLVHGLDGWLQLQEEAELPAMGPTVPSEQPEKPKQITNLLEMLQYQEAMETEGVLR